MPQLHDFLAIAVVHQLALMSPGPDFAMISRNSLVYSRRTGVWSAFGLALGIIVHVTYSMLGIGYVVSKSIVAFSTMKLLGAAYLIYIGWKCLKARPAAATGDVAEKRADLTRGQAIRLGFFTNALNPKAALYFLALFTQVIDPQTPAATQVLYGVQMSAMTFAWFALVAMVFSHRLVKDRFAAVQHRVEQAFGVLLVAFGLKLAFSKAK